MGLYIATVTVSALANPKTATLARTATCSLSSDQAAKAAAAALAPSVRVASKAAREIGSPDAPGPFIKAPTAAAGHRKQAQATHMTTAAVRRTKAGVRTIVELS